MPRFSANLSMLYGELPFLERFAAACEAGFDHVECMFPYEQPADAVRARLRASASELVLFNLPAGDWAAGDRGIAADPARVDEFRAGVEQALAYATALDCPRLNCLAGCRRDDCSHEEQWATLVANVRHAARRVAADGRTLLIESVNPKDVPGFLVPTLDDAVRLLDEVDEEATAIQFDVYHVQRSQGDVTTNLRALLPRIGHVQVADAPGRHQPGTGELNFAFLFDELDRLGYDGCVGLEYVPDPDTATSLAWRETLSATALDGRS